LQLKFTKDGIFRRFGFVGYLNEEQAQRAIDKLNKSYIGTSKIIVEQCLNLNDDNRPRPWSKYSQQTHEPIKKSQDDTKLKTKKKGNNKLVDAILGDLKDDEKFKEFVKNVDSMKKSEQIIWNDTMKNTEEVKKKPIEQPPTAPVPPPAKEEKSKIPRYLIKIRGIPYSSKERDIREFFSPISIVHIRMIHNRKTHSLTGVCWIELENEDDMNKAMLKQKSILTIEKTGEHRYLELSSFIKNKSSANKSTDDTKKPLKTYEPIHESIGETGELFVRNLSYRTTEQDLEQLFNPFGQVTTINMPIDSLTKQPKGFAHVTFMFPEHALKAFNELDGHAFQGRLLHILPGKTQQKETSASTDNQTPTSIATSSEQNWNSLFLSSNVIAEIMAERYGLDKSSISTSTKKNDSLAVRLAVGETQIIHETRQFLVDNGVQLDAFSQALSNTKRSNTVILAKNLPTKTDDQDLRILFEKYGKLERIILPPYGHCALIVFQHPQEARPAFKQLSFRKFKDNRPLYLEWAPGNVLSGKIKQEEKPVSLSWNVRMLF
jgi:multiple RNA-binding domain-containing protein 1